jgi:photosystem II stability/assembly factor-like uncharacterized protein
LNRARLVCAAALLVCACAGAGEPARNYPLAAKSLILDMAATRDALIAVADRGIILRSTDAGKSWQQQASPVDVMLTGIFMVDAKTGWAVGHDAVILHTTDGGTQWAVKFQDPEHATPLFDIWFENAAHGIAVGAYGLMRETTDGGATWTERLVSEDEPHLYTITQTKDGALFIIGEMGSIFRSEDNGASWSRMASPYEGTFFGGLALNDGGLLVYGLRGKLFRSDDSGRNWTPLSSGTEASLLGALQRTDGSVVVVGLFGTVLTSADGRTFTVIGRNAREALGGAVETSADSVLMFGEKGTHALAKEATP